MLPTLVESVFGNGNGRLVDKSQRLVEVEVETLAFRHRVAGEGGGGSIRADLQRLIFLLQRR